MILQSSNQKIISLLKKMLKKGRKIHRRERGANQCLGSKLKVRMKHDRNQNQIVFRLRCRHSLVMI
jgi:hypothetical protein